MGSNMIIDIPSTKTYYINLDDKIERKLQTEQHLTSLNFKNIERYSAKRGKNAIEGCALSHIDILRKNASNTPFFILEDDIGPNYCYISQIEIPDDVDAIYFGYSMWGYDIDRAKKFSKMDTPTSFIEVKKGVYKLTNMLSTHAIMYCSKRYALAAADIMEQILEKENWHCDYAVSLIQNNFNVYAPSKPYFVQSDHWTFPWTSIGLEDFNETNAKYKKAVNDPRLNP
jgi:hypothetical protein